MVFTLFSSSTEYGIFFNFRDVLKHYFCIFSPLITISYTPSSLPSFHTCTHSHATKQLWCLWTGTRMGTGCWQHPGTIWSRCMTSGPWRRCTPSRDTRRMSTVREMGTHRLTTNSSYLRQSGLVPRLSFEFGIELLDISHSQDSNIWYIAFSTQTWRGRAWEILWCQVNTNMEGEGDIVMSGKHKHGGGGGDIVMSGKHKHGGGEPGRYCDVR